MKKITLFTFVLFCAFTPFACDDLEKIRTAISDEDITSGLKEALRIGSHKAGTELHVTNAYFGNQALKILLPADARALIEKTYSIPGAETLLTPIIATVIQKMNDGAERAANKSIPIFVNAITTMTLTVARNVLLGDDTAATSYLKRKTFANLTTAFAPSIDSTMNEVGAGTAWNSLFSNYNSFVNPLTRATLGLETINPNLGEYATGRALNGLFIKVAEQEKSIRNNQIDRTSDLLKRVFKLQDPD